MRKVVFFVVGAVIGILVCFAALYVSGSVFESFGIRLYESEADQQRNFNLFLVASVISGLAGGYFFARKLA